MAYQFIQLVVEKWFMILQMISLMFLVVMEGLSVGK